MPIQSFGEVVTVMDCCFTVLFTLSTFNFGITSIYWSFYFTSEFSIHLVKQGCHYILSKQILHINVFNPFQWILIKITSLYIFYELLIHFQPSFLLVSLIIHIDSENEV